MPYKTFSEKNFSLPDEYTINCRAEGTRYGFRHLASLFRNGYLITKYKACYYNRTWESYEFQTVIRGVLRKNFGDDKVDEYEQAIQKKEHEEIEKRFGMVGAIAKLGEVFCEKTEDKNKWKQRMLKAGLSGLDFPEDFDTLPEEEKERRLDEVIKLSLNKEE